MTTLDAELDRMRQAFAGDTAAGVDCPPSIRIWEAVNGQLEPSGAAAVVDHVSSCGACAEAWRIARELEVEEAGGRTVIPFPGKRRASAVWPLLAAAAILVLAIGAWPLLRGTPAPATRRHASHRHRPAPAPRRRHRRPRPWVPRSSAGRAVRSRVLVFRNKLADPSSTRSPSRSSLTGGRLSRRSRGSTRWRAVSRRRRAAVLSRRVAADRLAAGGRRGAASARREGTRRGHRRAGAALSGARNRPMIRCLLLVVALLGAGAPQQHTPTPLDREVMRAFELLGQSKFEEARAELTRIADQARAAGNHTAAAESARGLAKIAMREQRLAEAKVLLARALEQAEASRVDFFIGEALNDLGFVAYTEGNGEDTRKYYQAAAERYVKSGAVTAYANALRNTTFASGMTRRKMRCSARRCRWQRLCSGSGSGGAISGATLFAGDYTRRRWKDAARRGAVRVRGGARRAGRRDQSRPGEARTGIPGRRSRTGRHSRFRPRPTISPASRGRNAIATAVSSWGRHTGAVTTSAPSRWPRPRAPPIGFVSSARSWPAATWRSGSSRRRRAGCVPYWPTSPISTPPSTTSPIWLRRSPDSSNGMRRSPRRTPPSPGPAAREKRTSSLKCS